MTTRAEDALHSERAARHTLSRRGMMGALAAMAAGSLVSLPALASSVRSFLLVNGDFSESDVFVNGVIYSWSDIKLTGDEFVGVISISYDGPASDIGCHISEAIRVADLGPGGVGSGEG